MATPVVWKDIHALVNLDARGAIKTVINVDAVITSLDNILRTRPGERVFLPTFGAGLQDMVFEPTSEEYFDSISDTVVAAINLWDDRVIINSIRFQGKPDANEMSVKVNFGIRGYDEIFEYETKLFNG